MSDRDDYLRSLSNHPSSQSRLRDIEIYNLIEEEQSEESRSRKLGKLEPLGRIILNKTPYSEAPEPLIFGANEKGEAYVWGCSRNSSIHQESPQRFVGFSDMEGNRSMHPIDFINDETLWFDEERAIAAIKTLRPKEFDFGDYHLSLRDPITGEAYYFPFTVWAVMSIDG